MDKTGSNVQERIEAANRDIEHSVSAIAVESETYEAASNELAGLSGQDQPGRISHLTEQIAAAKRAIKNHAAQIEKSVAVIEQLQAELSGDDGPGLNSAKDHAAQARQLVEQHERREKIEQLNARVAEAKKTIAEHNESIRMHSEAMETEQTRIEEAQKALAAIRADDDKIEKES